MNPHAARPISPLQILRSFVANWGLIYSLVQREIVGRYRGSAMGLLWSFFNPLLMLVVYTFVFSVVFQARWTGGSGSKIEFAMVLFSGLMGFNLFSETVNRSPQIILGNVNYVKRVVFPLEILPVVVLGSAVFHFLVNFVVWLAFYILFLGAPHYSVLLLPVALLPLILLSLGVGWFLASLGVFLRDIGHVIGVLTMALMYMTPIFYPASVLPSEYRDLMSLNPLTSSIEQIRNIMMWGVGLNWMLWMREMALASAIGWLGFSWFQKTRAGFADVV